MCTVGVHTAALVHHAVVSDVQLGPVGAGTWFAGAQAVRARILARRLHQDHPHQPVRIQLNNNRPAVLPKLQGGPGDDLRLCSHL